MFDKFVVSAYKKTERALAGTTSFSTSASYSTATGTNHRGAYDTSACTTTTRLLVTRCVRPRSWGSGGFETEVTDTKRRSKPGVASMKPGYTRKSERARRRFRAPRRADRTSRHPRFRHPRCRGLALGPSRRPQRRRRRAGRRHQQARRCHQQARRCHKQARRCHQQARRCHQQARRCHQQARRRLTQPTRCRPRKAGHFVLCNPRPTRSPSLFHETNRLCYSPCPPTEGRPHARTGSISTRTTPRRLRRRRHPRRRLRRRPRPRLVPRN